MYSGIFILHSLCSCFVLGDLRPTCAAINGGTGSISEKAPTGTCSETVYTCTNLAQLDMQCADSTLLFDLRCSSTGPGTVNVTFCSTESLDQLVGQETVSHQPVFVLRAWTGWHIGFSVCLSICHTSVLVCQTGQHNYILQLQWLSLQKFFWTDLFLNGEALWIER